MEFGSGTEGLAPAGVTRREEGIVTLRTPYI